MPVVYIGGTFDMFHEGHVNMLRQCHELAGKSGTVIVALNRDEFVERYKGRRPVVSYAGRKAVLEACRYVDGVIENSGDEDSRPAIERVQPDIIATDSAWCAEDYYAQMSFTQEWLDERSILLVYLPRKAGVSTTGIRSALP
jgi:glycerol-3-phosphate cytidylyltransferase